MLVLSYQAKTDCFKSLGIDQIVYLLKPFSHLLIESALFFCEIFNFIFRFFQVIIFLVSRF